MKRFILFLLISLSFSLSSCYEDYIEDFEYNSVYFPYQENTRTLVVGEDMTIKVGVTLAGVMENNERRVVNFQVDPNLLDGTGYTLLPSDYYSLSNNEEIVIESGWHQGAIEVIGDFAKITGDPDMLPASNQKYALPLVITGASNVDSILSSKKHAIIALKYENMLFGNYWHFGSAIVKDAEGNEIQTLTYDFKINAPESDIWKATTLSGNKIKFKGTIPGLTGNPFTVEMVVTYDNQGTAIGVEAAEGATYQIVAEGTSSFNNAEKLEERELVLNYKFERDGNTWYVSDKLKFRNRIRDGINEWQGYGARVR